MSSQKKLKKKRQQQIKKPARPASTQNENEYQQGALISNLCMICFSALYLIALFLPYVYPDEIIIDGPRGRISVEGPVTAMQFFVFSFLYPGTMSLVCLLSILSIILEKSFGNFIAVCVIVCFPEFVVQSYFLCTEFIVSGRGLTLFGSGFYLLLVSLFGLMISLTYHLFNEDFGRQ
jgi:hypothetical protein